MASTSFGLDVLVRSRPVDVEMFGLRSTTLEMQYHGWDFVADESYDRWEIRLMARHRDSSLVVHLEPVGDVGMLLGHYGRGSPHLRDPEPFRASKALFRAKWMSQEHQCRVIVTEPLDFKPVDMRPEIVNLRETSLDEFSLFRSLSPKVQEILVEPKDVQECLDIIKRLQAPALQDIRKRNEARERREATRAGIVHAQVLSLAA